MAAMMIAGAAVSAYGSYQQGKSDEAITNANASMARQDAKAKAMALNAEREHKTRQDRFDVARLRGSNLKRGIMMDVGSPMLTEAKEIEDDAYDRLELQRQSRIATLKGEHQASIYEAQGEAASNQGTFSLIGGLASGAGQAAGAYK